MFPKNQNTNTKLFPKPKKGLVGRPSDARAKQVVADFWAKKSQNPNGLPPAASQNPFGQAEAYLAERAAEKTISNYD